MPVRVNIPIHILVDPGALSMRARCIESALTAAVGRALKKSSEIVLDARGGYAKVEVSPPEIRWIGSALNEVPRGVRSATHERIAAALAKAVEAAKIVAADAEDGVAPALPDDISESVDWERYAPSLEAYLIPSYQGPPRKIAAKIKSKGAKTGTTDVGKRTGKRNIALGRIDSHWTDPDRVRIFIKARRAHDDRLPVGSGPGVMGLLGFDTAGEYQFLFFQVTDVQQPILSVSDVRFLIGATLFRPAPGPLPLVPVYALRWFPANSPDDQSIIEHHLSGPILQVLEDEQKLHPIPKPDFEARKKKRVKEELAAIKADPNIKSFINVSALALQTSFFGHTKLDVPAVIPRAYLMVLPLLESVAEGKRATQATGDAGRAGGRRGPGTGAAAARARARGQSAKRPPGPSGTGAATSTSTEARRSRPASALHAEDRDCTDDYIDRSASNPEGYLDDTDFLQCRSLLHEPGLDDLGDDGAPLQARIDRLATAIGISSCRFGGNFCLGAGQAIAKRAWEIAENPVMEVAGNGGVLEASKNGNFGYVQFDPRSTPAIQHLRTFAGLLDDVIELSERVKTLYRAWWPFLCGRWYQHGSQWGLAFDVLFHPIKNEAIEAIFKATCKVLLLQLLESSRLQIEARKKTLSTYAPVFEFLLRAHFTRKGELEALKARLEQGMFAYGLFPQAFGQIAGSWAEVSGSLFDQLHQSSAMPADSLTIKDDLVFNGKKLVGIQDEHGNLWTKEALEQALTRSEFLVESADPMIKQFSNDEANFVLSVLNQKSEGAQLKLQTLKLGDFESAVIRKIFEKKQITTEVVVDGILAEMLNQNTTQMINTLSDVDYAFDTAPLRPREKGSVAPATPYVSFALQGVHRLADEQIRSAFREHPRTYGWELNDVLSAKAGSRALKGFFEMVGLIVLSIACPPLGTIAGAALAVREYGKALEKKALFRALIDPDEIISRAEVEAELFAAELGLALAFLPHAPKILGVATKGITAIARRGQRVIVNRVERELTVDAAEAAAAAIRRRFAMEVAEALKDDFVEMLATELLKNELIDLFMGKLIMEPAFDHIQEEFKDYSHGGSGPRKVLPSFRQVLEVSAEINRPPETPDARADERRPQ